MPVDFVVTRAAVARRTVEAAGYRLPERVGQPSLQLFDDALNHQPGGLAGLGGDCALQRDERGNEVNVRLQRLQHFALEQQLLEIEPLHRVLLHDSHDRGREILANIAKPAGHGGRGASQSAAAL